MLSDLGISTDSQTSILLEDINNNGDPEIIVTKIQVGGLHTYQQGALYTVAKGQALVIENPINAEYSGPLAYSVWRGNDATFFCIDVNTGALTFKGPESEAAPEDANNDSIYEVWIAVSDGVAEIHRKILVQVID